MEPINKMRPIHPGEILREEFLIPLGMTAHALSLELKVPAPQDQRHCPGAPRHHTRYSAQAGPLLRHHPAVLDEPPDKL